jgi:tetratricopeptide (TPR) repeat protein
MKISACIISRKEDEMSAVAAVNSIRDFVEEIIIVDTSKEGKFDLEGTFGSWGDQGGLSIIPFEWTGSFADARNFSFSKATGDVILWIDSDDVVLNPENIRPLAQHIVDGDVDWIYSEYLYSKDENGMVNARHWKYRLVKEGTGEWKGRVHEDYIPNQAVVQMKDSDLDPEHRIFIDHNIDYEHAKASAERNLAIQLQEIEEEGENVDARTLQYTAMSLQGLERYDEAIPLFLRHMRLSGSLEDKFWSAQRIAMCLIFLGNYDEALTPARHFLSGHCPTSA